MHRQSAIGKDVGVMIDMGKKVKKSKTKADELFREQHLSLESRKILQSFAQGFIESCFNRMCCVYSCSIHTLLMTHSVLDLAVEGHQVRAA